MADFGNNQNNAICESTIYKAWYRQQRAFCEDHYLQVYHLRGFIVDTV